MPFELIMLMGFFGATLLGLLPTAAADVTKHPARRRRPARRSDGGTRKAERSKYQAGRLSTLRPAIGGARRTAGMNRGCRLYSTTFIPRS